MECFTPGVGNTCGTGAFGVADPATLGFRYYVKLDPAEIPKAMFAETSPDGSLIWTSSGDDLLAYRSSDVSQANRGPTGPLLHAVRRLPGAVPPTGVTGAVFRKGRLLLAGEAGGVYQVWSVNTDTGERRLEREMRICGESEGLDVVPTLGGELHWLIAPFDPGCQLTFGPTSALLHFVPTPAHERYQVEVTDTDVALLPGEVRATVHATHRRPPPSQGAGDVRRRNGAHRQGWTRDRLHHPGGARALPGARAEGPELRCVGSRTRRRRAVGAARARAPVGRRLARLRPERRSPGRCGCRSRRAAPAAAAQRPPAG